MWIWNTNEFLFFLFFDKLQNDISERNIQTLTIRVQNFSFYEAQSKCKNNSLEVRLLEAGGESGNFGMFSGCLKLSGNHVPNVFFSMEASVYSAKIFKMYVSCVVWYHGVSGTDFATGSQSISIRVVLLYYRFH